MVGPLHSNCYMIWTSDTNKGVIIDPGYDTENIMNMIKSKGVKIEGIYLTHGHADHIGSAQELHEILKVDIYGNKEDDMFYKDLKALGDFYMPKAKPIVEYKHLKDNEEINFGSAKVKVIYTPGHSPGGLCFLMGNAVITGDTLFKRSIGRSDFPKGDLTTLLISIKTKLYTLPESTVIYPGHYGSSTIGEEKLSNPHTARL